jgi:site-specific recombinase XerD
MGTAIRAAPWAAASCRVGVGFDFGFPDHLATKLRVSASTQNQALGAILFLYTHVIGRTPDELGEFVRAPRPRTLPVVLSVSEVSSMLDQMQGAPRLMAALLYGSGLRLLMP